MLNQVQLIGHLGKDPELKELGEGKSVAKFSLATSDGKNTEWHNIVVWDRQAENCAKFLKKGSLIYIQGRNSTRMWEKDGQKHYTTDVVANTVKFLDKKPKEDEVAVDPVEIPY